jgi:hypothetical protein
MRKSDVRQTDSPARLGAGTLCTAFVVPRSRGPARQTEHVVLRLIWEAMAIVDFIAFLFGVSGARKVDPLGCNGQYGD